MATNIRSAPANRAQVWLPLAMLLVAIASTWAAFTGAALGVVTLAVAGLAGYLIVRYPYLGVGVYLITFLLTYPAALRGYGNLTINNVLGMILFPMLLFGTLRDGIGWFWRARPLVWLIAIGAIMLTAGTIYNQHADIQGRAGVVMRARGDKELFATSTKSEGQIVSTRDQRVKFVTRYAFLLFFVFFVRTPRQAKVMVALLLGILFMTYMNVSTEAGELGWGAERLKVVRGSAGAALYTGTNPNKLAFYVLVCTSLLWYMRKRIRSVLLWPIWGAAFLSALSVIPLTASRSGFLNLLLFLGIVLFEGRTGLRQLLGLVLAATLAVAQFGYDFSVLDLMLPERVTERLASLDPDELRTDGQTATSSFQRRFGNLTTAVKLVSVNPLLGVGLDNYESTLEFYNPTADIGPPHNSYLWAAVEGGLVSLALYLVCFAWILRRLNNLLKDYRGRFGPVDLEWLVAALRTNMVLFLAFSFFADIWVHIFFHVLVGLSLVVIQIHRTYAETGEVPGSEIGAPLREGAVPT